MKTYLDTFFTIKSRFWVLGIIDFDQDQIHEISDIVRVQGPLVFRDVGLDHLLNGLEGFVGLIETEIVSQNRPLGHRRMRQNGGQEGKCSAGFPEEIVEHLDDVGQFGVVQLEFFSNLFE
jgi:hypothetical protein